MSMGADLEGVLHWDSCAVLGRGGSPRPGTYMGGSGPGRQSQRSRLPGPGHRNFSRTCRAGTLLAIARQPARKAHIALDSIRERGARSIPEQDEPSTIRRPRIFLHQSACGSSRAFAPQVATFGILLRGQILPCEVLRFALALIQTRSRSEGHNLAPADRSPFVKYNS